MKRYNRRRREATGGELKICPAFAPMEGGYCRNCRCERAGCMRPKNASSRRWCKSHYRDATYFDNDVLKEKDFATTVANYSFPAWANDPWKVVLRTNFLHDLLLPDDNEAWQEVCLAQSMPAVGRRMSPVGIVQLVIAHAIKWPPAVRHFNSKLIELAPMETSQERWIVDALYDTVLWADKLPLKEMHAVLSVSQRSHAVSGLAVNAAKLGLLDKQNPGGTSQMVVNLGPAGKPHY